MKKHLTNEQLAVYSEMLAGFNVGKIPDDIIEHIQECDICAGQAIELSNIIKESKKNENLKTIDHQNNNENVKEIKPNYIRRYLAMAASLLLPLAMIFLYNYIKNKNSNLTAETNIVKETVHIKNKIDTSIILDKDKHDNNEKIAVSNGSVKRDKIQNKSLLAYVPNKEMEKLASNYKGNMRGNEIDVLTKDVVKVKFGKTFELKWKNEENINLTVEIFNNNANQILSKIINESSYNSDTKFKKGLYYWKLINEDFDLLFCGKIVVK